MIGNLGVDGIVRYLISRLLRQALESRRAAAWPAPSGGALRPGRVPADFAQTLERVALAHGLDPNLVAAIVQAESNFNPSAVSRAGAQGLMQLMPGTSWTLGVTDPFDPVQNLEGGTRFLSGLIARYQSLPLALAAYNAGPGAVDRYGGIPPYQETQTYVRRVLELYEQRAG